MVWQYDVTTAPGANICAVAIYRPLYRPLYFHNPELQYGRNFGSGANMAQFRYIVTDVHQAVAFYTSNLGFSLEQNFAPAMAILRRDDLVLWTAGPSASASKPMPDGAKPESGGWNRIVIPVEDLAEFVQKLRKNGVKFRNEIVKGPGGSQILCEDPSGNPIELFQAA